jgi:hypothetical protein
LREAVHNSNEITQHRTGEASKPALPNDWNGIVSLSLAFDESSSLNPGIASNLPMASAISTFGVVDKVPVTTSTPQSFSLGFGPTLSSTATRIDKFDPSWTINYLSEYPKDDPDHPYARDPVYDPIRRNANSNPARSSPLIARDSGLNITSDLGPKDWLLGATVASNYLCSVV